MTKLPQLSGVVAPCRQLFDIAPARLGRVRQIARGKPFEEGTGPHGDDLKRPPLRRTTALQFWMWLAIAEAITVLATYLSIDDIEIAASLPIENSLRRAEAERAMANGV
ncbi:hypothetical protein FQV39_29795 (plasmid) [Bosea sp. F3-2]|uniref:hypothetical protein n=1 Tax=Bosea sp. F3-2 TaxID=2599640 RepID=UPI0011EC01DE|nr:hypothetical protein [Bosea sp. F3-2]QEL26865.1 hypothetical protein FQV39_29795 [Bosea sp. F3-2]